MKLLCLLAVLLTGCASAPVQHGISNFYQVESGVYRGGQPNEEGIAFMRAVGAEDFKLNCGTDGFLATTNIYLVQGLQEYDCQISFWRQIAAKPDKEKIEALLANIKAAKNQHTPIFIHCTHGQDRTGLIVACYRVRVDGWSKVEAEKEMLEHGFHRSEFALWRFWKEFQP